MGRKNSSLLLIIFLICVSTYGWSQCNSNISLYPYLENFEASDGGWTTNTISSDWAWGSPIKPTINKASSGTKCWVTGGLTNSSYMDNESGWLQSPCFDLSPLKNPYLSFKVFWETEKTWDGATFQYSLDNGTTWLILGSYTEALNCPNDNWFDTKSISTLSRADGWSGNIQTNPNGRCVIGGGSGGWVTSQHTIANLAGQKKVIFRFLFGSGTTCNGFDGFAIDDINIGEAPPIKAGYTYTCGTKRTVNFLADNAPCPTTYSWDFNDLASGLNNTAATLQASHTFSAPGTYTITLTISNPSTASDSYSQTINVQDATINVNKSILCNGDKTGELQVNITGLPTNYSYLWNNDAQLNTATISNLPAGNYSVVITKANTCIGADAVTLTNPTLLKKDTAIISQPVCATKGQIKLVESGGTPTYTYTWSPNVSDKDTAANLSAGTYIVKVTDMNNCVDNQTFTLVNTPTTINLNLGNDTVICPGEQLILDAGSFANYQWQDQSVKEDYIVTKTGSYSVKVTDKDGCTATDAINVTVKCNDIFFPSGFTPNSSSVNNVFIAGPQDALSSVTSFNLQVYNRFGQLVFQSKDPYKPWRGDVNGRILEGVYIWHCNYTIGNRKVNTKKGTLVLLR